VTEVRENVTGGLRPDLRGLFAGIWGAV